MVGVKSGDLPGALTMLADYFQRQSSRLDAAQRLDGLSDHRFSSWRFLISIVIAFCRVACIGNPSKDVFWSNWDLMLPSARNPMISFETCGCRPFWVFPVALGVLFLFTASIIISAGNPPPISALAAARFSGSLVCTEVASSSYIAAEKQACHLMPDSIGLVEHLETNTTATAEKEISRWRQQLVSRREARESFPKWPTVSRLISRRFSSGSVVQCGRKICRQVSIAAAEIYHSRAMYRTEMFRSIPAAVLNCLS